MKKFIILFVLALCFGSKAQIQITSGDVQNVLAPGTAWQVSSSDDPQVSMNVGIASGSAQNWASPNISWQETRTLFNVTPASTPYSSYFPTATHSQYTTGDVQGFPATLYQYFRIETNMLVSLGNVIHVQTSQLDTFLVTVSNENIFPLPLTYGTSQLVSRDSIDIGGGFWDIITVTQSVDAFGSFTFPFGTYDVLRIKNTEETEVYFNGTVINQYGTTYFNWISKQGGIFEGDIDSSSVTSGTIPLYSASMTQFNTPTSVDDKKDSSVPSEFILYQNYPNPFNPSTIIKYSVPATSNVTIKVYDIIGNEVATLVNETKPAGTYEIKFDGKNLSSGIYFYKMTAGSSVQTKKMILIK